MSADKTQVGVVFLDVKLEESDVLKQGKDIGYKVAQQMKRSIQKNLKGATQGLAKAIELPKIKLDADAENLAASLKKLEVKPVPIRVELNAEQLEGQLNLAGEKLTTLEKAVKRQRDLVSMLQDAAKKGVAGKAAEKLAAQLSTAEMKLVRLSEQAASAEIKINAIGKELEKALAPAPVEPLKDVPKAAEEAVYSFNHMGKKVKATTAELISMAGKGKIAPEILAKGMRRLGYDTDTVKKKLMEAYGASTLAAEGMSLTDFKFDTNQIREQFDYASERVEYFSHLLKKQEAGLAHYKTALESAATAEEKAKIGEIIEKGTSRLNVVTQYLDRAKSDIAMLGKEFQKVLNPPETSPAMEEIVEKPKQATYAFNLMGERVRATTAELLEMARAGSIAPATLAKGLKSLGFNAEQARAKMSEIYGETKKVEAATKSTGSRMRSAKKAAAGILAPIALGARHMGTLKKETDNTTSSMKRLKKAASGGGGILGGLKGGLKKLSRFGLAAMGIRSIFTGIRKLSQNIGQNFKIMADRSAEFKNQLNGITQATDALKGAFAAAAAPLAQMFLPAMQKIAEWTTRAINGVAILFAKLSGKSTAQIVTGSTKQFKSAMDEAAQSTAKADKGMKQSGKAAKELKRQLAGFDDLEILSFGKDMDHAADALDDMGSGNMGGGGADMGGGQPIFETINIGETQIGQFIDQIIGQFERLKSWISGSDLWQGIKNASVDAAQKIGDKWSEMTGRLKAAAEEHLPGVKENFSSLATSVSGAMGGIIEYIAGPMIAGAITTSLGLFGSLGEGILKVMETASELLANMFTPFTDAIKEFLEEHGPEIKSTIEETWATIESIGSNVIETVSTLISEVLGGLSGWWEEHGAEITEQVRSAFEDIWVVVKNVLNWFATDGKEMIDRVVEFIQRITPDIKETVVSVWNSIWRIVSVIWTNLHKTAMKVFGALGKFWEEHGETIKEVWDLAWTNVETLFRGALKIIREVFEFFANVFEGDWEAAWENVKNIFKTVLDTVEKIFDGCIDAIGAIFEDFGIDISGILDGIKKTFKGIIKFIKGVFTGDWRRAWEGVRDILKGIATTFIEIFKKPLNVIIKSMNKFIDGLNRIKVPDWVPGIGGKGINIPKIRELATGGIVTKPTLAMVGEQSKREAVLPLDRNTGWMDELADKLAARGASGGGGDIVIEIPVYLGDDQLVDVIRRVVDREGRRRDRPVFA